MVSLESAESFVCGGGLESWQEFSMGISEPSATLSETCERRLEIWWESASETAETGEKASLSEVSGCARLEEHVRHGGVREGH